MRASVHPRGDAAALAERRGCCPPVEHSLRQEVAALRVVKIELQRRKSDKATDLRARMGRCEGQRRDFGDCIP